MSRDGGAQVEVRGGTGGTMVGLDALDAAAAVLLDVAGDVAGVLARIGLVAADPDLAASARLSPLTAARAGAALASCAGPLGLSGDAASLGVLAAAVRTATSTYREADAEVARTVAAAQDAVMFVVGRHAPEIVVGVLALDALGVDVATVFDEAAYDFPVLADLGGGVDGLVAGLATDWRTAPMLVPGLVTGDGDNEPEQPVRDDDGYEDAIRILADSAAVLGLLSDRGRARVTAESRPRQGAAAPVDLASLASDQLNLSDGEAYPGRVRVIEIPQQHGSAWIVEVSGTQAWQPRAGANAFDVTTDARIMAQESTVLAEGVERALALAKESSAVAAAGPSGVGAGAGGGGGSAGGGGAGSAGGAGGSVAVRPGREAEPVMLVGHSLGGIVAAGLASAPAFTERHHVTHVVAMGSPIARMPVASGVQVLSLEHRQDPVPRLDGQVNPDRLDWVTVTRDLDRGATGVDRASSAHATSEYVETAAAADTSTEPSVAAWREGSRQFFGTGTGTGTGTGASAAAGAEGGSHGAPVIRDFRIERVAPPG